MGVDNQAFARAGLPKPCIKASPKSAVRAKSRPCCMNIRPATSSGGFAASNVGNAGEGAFGDPSAVSPVSNRSLTSADKKRSRDNGVDTSSSGEDSNIAGGDKRRYPGVKRACNECRQQKLRCDVATSPTYMPCSRCRRLQLNCRIDDNFRRVGKRSKNAEMEREIVELRRQLAQQQGSYGIKVHSVKPEPSSPNTPSVPSMQSTVSQYLGDQDAVASLMGLKSGLEGGSFSRSPSGQMGPLRCIGDVALAQPRVLELFQT